MSEPAEGRPIRVLLVDDDALVCQGLELILSSAPDIEVVGSVDDGDRAVPAVQQHFPDVVLLDVRMQRLDGIAATGALRALANPPKVIVLTTFDADDVVMRAIGAGASGFLLKTAAATEIIDAIRNVAGGNGALSPQSVRQVFQQVQAGGDTGRRAARDAVATLTDRELAVVRLVGEGLSNGQIAAQLYVGEATVKTHLTAAQQKLGVGNRVQVAVVASRAGLV
ncbi:response regulator transcription factor [Flexivirga meconopsidis]|uniref:response regulator transcription factor n=1 Tax=Flexivirga meconopsidis TaxID=2977121 RepID=UPI00224071E8|nr:response regulator transcription factor [Flexivirga meconopsidis]